MASNKLIAKPSRRDLSVRSARFAQLTLPRLAEILQAAENGQLADFADLCDRMIEVDAEVRAAVETRLAAITGSRRYVESGALPGDDEQTRADADLIARAYDHALSLCDTLDDAAQGLLHGGIFMGTGAAEIEWQFVDGVMLPVGLHWVHTRRLAIDREWRTCLADDGEQYSYPGQPLERGKWLVHEPKTVAGYKTRTGVLRSAATPYVFKRWCTQFWVSGAESFAWPLVYGKVPRGATETARAAFQSALEALTPDQRLVLDAEDEIAMLETTVKDGSTWKELFEHMSAEISKAILGMSDLSQGSKIGAYGAVESRKGATVDARIALDEKALAATFKRDLGRPFAEYNAHLTGGRVARAPIVRWAVASQQKEIPAYVLPYMQADEIRATMDLPPLAKAAPSDSVLNGAQVQSLVLIVQGVSQGLIPKSGGAELIQAAFPSIDRATAQRMLGDAVAPAPAPTDAELAPIQPDSQAAESVAKEGV